MESRNRQKIRKWLKDKHFPSGAIILDGPQSGPNLVFVPASSVGHKKTTGMTSARQMAYLKKMASRDLAIDIEFLIAPDNTEADIESGMCAIVRRVLSEQEAKAFLTIAPSGMADVWLDTRVSVGVLAQERILASLKDRLGNYLSEVGLQLHQIYWQGSLIPSSPAVIRTVKVIAPATVYEIATQLEKNGYPSISEKWLGSQLDRLRRQGFLVWHNGKYILSDAGLTLLPQSKGRKSSDVERALALGKRRW